MMVVEIATAEEKSHKIELTRLHALVVVVMVKFSSPRDRNRKCALMMAIKTDRKLRKTKLKSFPIILTLTTMELNLLLLCPFTLHFVDALELKRTVAQCPLFTLLIVRRPKRDLKMGGFDNSAEERNKKGELWKTIKPHPTLKSGLQLLNPAKNIVTLDLLRLPLTMNLRR